MRKHLFAVLGALFLTAALSGCGGDPAPDPEAVQLVWNQEMGYRWADLPIYRSGDPGFEKISSSRTGIGMTNFLSEELMNENRILMNGSGVAAGDVDGDGLPDLYFTRLDGSNVLYRNLGGFRFEDITAEADVAHEGHYSTGAVFADVNGNGQLDLLVTTVDSENALYLNDGKGNFRLQRESGLQQGRGSMTMALADITGNGYPDLYLVNYRETNVLDLFEPQDLTWEETVRDGELIPPFDDYYTILDRGQGFSPERHEIGRQDELYLNNGDGTFTLVTDPENRFLAADGSPLGLYPDWGLAAKFHDLNGDGLQDLYVCNDFWTPDRIWINRGDGTFRAADSLAFRNSSFYSMTTDFGDINRDGFTDIFTVEMLDDHHSDRLQKRTPVEPVPLRTGEYTYRPQYNRNSLFLNRGDHTYAEISRYSGLHASEWSWSTRFIDIDLDGYEDVIILNGFAYDFQNLDSQKRLFDTLVQTGGEPRRFNEDFTPLYQQNRIFRNNRDLTFADVSSEWGFSERDISLGLALVDLDGDGLLDVVTSRMNDEPGVYRNSASGDRIAVRLKGSLPNSQAVGAYVELSGGPVERQAKQVISGGDYLSGSDPLMVFAADAGNPAHRLTITWPDGAVSRLDSLRANRVYEIDRQQIPVTDGSGQMADERPSERPSPGKPPPIFEERPGQPGHRHHEDPFNNFRIQPLLPYGLSRMGPGVAWLDLTGNGRDELIIGSGKGGETAVLEVREVRGNIWLEPSAVRLPQSNSPGDQTGIVGWREEDRTHLVIGVANYEIGTSLAPSALHYVLENGQVVSVDSLPGILSTTGPLAAADYTGDGAVDLFVGGRFLPGQYPADATSRLFRNVDGTLAEDRENNPLFENLGLVTGALFVDYNLSGEQDLIVTTEWGSLRLFENNGGRFTERTERLGLDRYKGLWQGIASGDFNEDGYPDLVAANRGENSIYRVDDPEQPLRLYYGDFNRDQRMDLIDAYYDQGIGDWVPRRGLPDYENLQDILWHVESNRHFSELSVSEMVNRDPEQLTYREANTLSHTVFYNREGGGFTAQALPAEAQFSAGFHVGIADLENDGHDDIYLTQNFFAVADPQSTPRLDGGRSLWLKGDGGGNFEPVPGHLSGVNVYGEQRGAAMGDPDGNGRVDLVVSQNASETKLFTSRTERQGIRVILEGPPGNRSGIGSGIRLVYTDGSKGPSRTVQAGSGYWSQNSAIQVLGIERELSAIEVKWFDGTLQHLETDGEQRELRVRYPSVE